MHFLLAGFPSESKRELGPGVWEAFGPEIIGRQPFTADENHPEQSFFAVSWLVVKYWNFLMSLRAAINSWKLPKD